MNRVLKTFLLWLLLLALPMQGYAAAVMLACGAVHSRSTLAADAATAHVHANHHHDSTPHVADAGHDSHGATADKHAGSACNTCQACCIGAVLISSGLDWKNVDDNAGFPVAALVTLFTGHIPGGLERPPRSHLV